MLTVIHGAEGCAEMADVPWMRDATPEEIAAFKEHHQIPEERAKELTIDGTGRPYWWKTLTEDAPQWAKDAVLKYGRIRRLSDYQV